jgi:hypothetical protein
MESTYEKIRELVAKSEVSLIQEQIWAQQKTILFLEERVTAFERLVSTYNKVTMNMAEELRSVVEQHLKVSSQRKTETGRYGRSVGEVIKRWAEWKTLDEGGMTAYQIARLWKVNIGSVYHAKERGYVVGPDKRKRSKSSVPASLIGHTLVALPPTRKGPRRVKNLLRLAA